MSVPNLPDELVAKILRYIPPSVLGPKFFRFQSVCHQWDRLINSGQALPKSAHLRILVSDKDAASADGNMLVVDKEFKAISADIQPNMIKLLQKLLPRKGFLLRLHLRIQSRNHKRRDELIRVLSCANVVSGSLLSALHIDEEYAPFNDVHHFVTIDRLIEMHGRTLQSITGPRLESTILLIVGKLLTHCHCLRELDLDLTGRFPHNKFLQEYEKSIAQLCTLLRKHKSNWRRLRLNFTFAEEQSILQVLSALPDKSGECDEEECFTQVTMDSQQLSMYFQGSMMNDQLKSTLTRIDQLDFTMYMIDEHAYGHTMGLGHIPAAEDGLAHILQEQNMKNTATINQFNAICQKATNLKMLNLKLEPLADYYLDVSSVIAVLCQNLHENTPARIEFSFKLPLTLTREFARNIEILRNVAELCHSQLQRCNDRKFACEMKMKSENNETETKVYFVFYASDVRHKKKLEIENYITDYLTEEM